MSESSRTPGSSRDIRDVVGIGFGPANLALAIAIEESNEAAAPDDQLSAVFFEAEEKFSWHPGMLLDGATMQIAFPKDLVTFRNPRSAYTFFSYLHDRGRLVDFVNHQTFFPTRHEFNDYLGWAASRVSADVRYGAAVTSVKPVPDEDGKTRLFEVVGADGTTVLTRNVVMGAGLRERIPEWATRSTRCFHNHNFLNHIGALPPVKHQRFAVLGAGQSAAEIVQYLHRNYPDAEVHNVFSRYGYSPADDSPYANRIFDPEAVDDLHSAPAEVRARLLDVHRSTNYSCVDIDLINELYSAEYSERVSGARRLFMRRASEIIEINDQADGIEVSIRSDLDGLTDTLTYDALVLATGFEPAPLEPLLGDIARNAQGVARDYQLVLSDDIEAGIYLQGGTERTHGLTSSLLSNVAVRAGEILAAVRDRCSSESLLATVNQTDPYVTSEAR
ncbi:MAG: lysine N(6)-hydroxylase/L-ornithine N(5)-oxygenase family protein [Rhodococcus sp.]|nr:lysine N(6)-hydroxylase/L-ornithine N(5)-oxygenase family protein [Rhodococcus sp. (in: high G+C Gram-positive bacteria)]